ncbi:MAG: hypothetical protein V4485_05255 [Pseudomonadota bacterium]
MINALIYRGFMAAISEVTKGLLEMHIKVRDIAEIIDGIEDAKSRNDTEYETSFKKVLCSNPEAFADIMEEVLKEEEVSARTFMLEAAAQNSSDRMMAQVLPTLRDCGDLDGIKYLINDSRSSQCAKSALTQGDSATVEEIDLLLKANPLESAQRLVSDMLNSDNTKRRALAAEVVVKYGTEEEIRSLASGVFKSEDPETKLAFCQKVAKSHKLGNITPEEFQSVIKGQEDSQEIRHLAQEYIAQNLATMISASKISEEDKKGMKDTVTTVLIAFSDNKEAAEKTADHMMRKSLDIAGKNLGFKERCNLIKDKIKDLCPKLFYSKEERKLHQIVKESPEIMVFKNAQTKLGELAKKTLPPNTSKSTSQRSL